MWEEHPEYQKGQAKLIGIGIALLAVCYIVKFTEAKDWDSLKELLLWLGALVIALALFPLCAWLLVRTFTRRSRNKKAKREGT